MVVACSLPFFSIPTTSTSPTSFSMLLLHLESVMRSCSGLFVASSGIFPLENWRKTHMSQSSFGRLILYSGSTSELQVYLGEHFLSLFPSAKLQKHTLE